MQFYFERPHINYRFLHSAWVVAKFDKILRECVYKITSSGMNFGKVYHVGTLAKFKYKLDTYMCASFCIFNVEYKICEHILLSCG